jgi:uncharacterized protein (TIGR02231 family)
MTRLFYALMLCSLVPAAAQAAEKPEDIAAKSEIRAVTVYNNRAKIVREAVVEVPKGAHAVTFSNLPAGLLPDSLRVEGSSEASVKIGAVAAKEIMSDQLAAPREKELSAQLEAVQDQVTLVNAEKAALAAEKRFFENIGQQATLRNNENLAQIDLKPEQWGGAGQAIHGGLGDVLKADAEQNVKLRDLGRQTEKLQAELDQLRTDARSSYQVQVPLEAAAAGKVTLELSYQVPEATWRPLYDARLESEKGALTLVQYGEVSQHTGEDWSGVALTLSTAQPQRGAGLPDLTPQWVDIYQAAPALTFKAMSSNISNRGQAMQQEASNMADSLAAPVAAAAPGAAGGGAPREEPKPVGFVAAQVNAGGFVSEYVIPGPSNVPADGTETRLMVGNFNTESKLEIHVKPQLSTEAFLVAKAKLKGDAPLLPGQVNLFRDGAFVGQAELPLLRPDEEHGLYFGVDDQVAVKRKVLKDERRETGVLKHDKLLERDVVTELQNLHKKPVEIVVKETVPVARNEKIHVEILLDEALTTPNFEQDAANIKGLLTWTVKIAPRDKQDVKLGWTVSWPSDDQLAGLQVE